jgi:hypothetical protein
MNIIAEFDNSVTSSTPAGYKTAVQAAINFVDHLIVNPITVTLMFSYGSLQGTALPNDALGESSTNGNVESYSDLIKYLTAAATSTADKESIAAQPATDPVSAASNPAKFWVSDTEAKIFGLGAEAGYTDPEDGFVALSSKYSFTYNASDRQASGEYDAIGVLEHEITEALGRISDLGVGGTFSQTENGVTTTYTLWSPLDLFRYSAAGQHAFNPGQNETDYFSVDGQHMLLPYNTIASQADTGDWDSNSVVGDSFGAGYLGTEGKISATDVLEMDVLGFKIALPRSTDFHNDGLSNLLIQNTAGAVDIGEVSNGSVTWASIAGLGPEWKFVGTGDFLGDGLSDFLIENTSGAVVAGEIGPDVAATYTTVAALGPEWTVVGAGNLMGDGKYDMLIENTNGLVDVGEADVLTGKMAFTQIASLGQEWKFVGVGDFLGEGHAQFLIENTSGSVAVGDIVNGKAQYTTVASLGPEWKFVETGDFLHDGKWDFLVENTSGAVAVGEIGANNLATYTTVASLGPEWKFVGAGDYLALGYAQFLIENTVGAVEVGKIVSGVAQYTKVAALGSEWTFHS